MTSALDVVVAMSAYINQHRDGKKDNRREVDDPVKFGAVDDSFLRQKILINVAQWIFPLVKLYRIPRGRMDAPNSGA
jgi:hypothetical protein